MTSGRSTISTSLTIRVAAFPIPEARLNTILAVNSFGGQVEFRIAYKLGRVIYYSGADGNTTRPKYLTFLENSAKREGKPLPKWTA